SGLTQLRKHVKTIRAAAAGEAAEEKDPDELRRYLAIDGYGDDLSNEILSGVRQRLREARRAGGQGHPMRELKAELADRLRVSPLLGADHAIRKVTALVGPHGAGKTSMIVKLAVRYGLTGRKPVRLISLDAGRPGGTDALRAYAAGMAVPLDVVSTGAAVSQVIEAHQNAGLVLIDTPPVGPSDAAGASEWMTALARNPEVDVQLVLPATMSADSLRLTYQRFRTLLPSRLVITQTDSAASCGPALALAITHDKSLSFLSTGPAVPEDVEEANLQTLLRIDTSAGNNTAGNNTVVSAA
ncbi:MAG: hypothetical protein JO022_02200, partial [Acidobacteriaceae bacterium]|nr:hypothetical protein [Acidobacteriaceae bacterium]